MAGNAFQRTGEPTLNDLSAKVLHFVNGLTNKFISLFDLSPPLVWWSQTDKILQVFRAYLIDTFMG